MERVTSTIRGLRQRPGTPSPTGSEATEDEGQRLLEDMSGSEMSDKNPAGCAEYRLENDPHTQDSAGGGRSEEGALHPDASVTHHHDTQGNTGRGDVKLVRPSDVPVGHRDNSRREVSLDVRLTVVEREAIRHRAQVLGVKPSAWARAVMLDALDVRSERLKALEITAKDNVAAPQSLAPVVEQLRRVGVNLNQVLRRGVAVDGDLLREVVTAVDSLRASLGDRTHT